jgi:hypothetical protein
MNKNFFHSTLPVKLKIPFPVSGYLVDRAAGNHLVSKLMWRVKPLGLVGYIIQHISHDNRMLNPYC